MNNKYYNHFDFYNLKNTPTFTILENFKTYQQTTDYTCGPACAKMVLNYYNDFNYNEMQLKKLMKSNSSTGTSLKNMTAFFENNGYKVESSLSVKFKIKTFKQFKKYLITQLKNKNAIIIENVDYGGHYKVVIGYDQVNEDELQDMLIFADSSDFNDGLMDGYNYFPAERFFAMWFDYNCLEPEERIKPFLTVFNPKH